jgi:hypothetical protein
MLLDTYIKYIQEEIATSGVVLLAMTPLNETYRHKKRDPERSLKL